MKKILIFFINLYQKIISPYLPQSCRFYPTCSEYAKKAIYKYGVLKGTVKSIKRLFKCHPWHEGGYDPVD
ncbi:MAG: membrane protein insertion efficiency factor YidD [Candidatus Goldbacteria bacterium]|nr:membrane protein insertion efficiency factor YidD [Candidatus Goldiibacteriota bacterium]